MTFLVNSKDTVQGNLWLYKLDFDDFFLNNHNQFTVFTVAVVMVMVSAYLDDHLKSEDSSEDIIQILENLQRQNKSMFNHIFIHMYSLPSHTASSTEIFKNTYEIKFFLHTKQIYGEFAMFLRSVITIKWLLVDVYKGTK